MDMCINFSTQGVESLGHRIRACLILLELPKSLSPWLCHVTLFQQRFRVLAAPHPLQNLVFLVFSALAIVVGV